MTQIESPIVPSQPYDVRLQNRRHQINKEERATDPANQHIGMLIVRYVVGFVRTVGFRNMAHSLVCYRGLPETGSPLINRPVQARKEKKKEKKTEKKKTRFGLELPGHG